MQDRFQGPLLSQLNAITYKPVTELTGPFGVFFTGLNEFILLYRLFVFKRKENNYTVNIFLIFRSQGHDVNYNLPIKTKHKYINDFVIKKLYLNKKYSF